jgi:hypothetical protein
MKSKTATAADILDAAIRSRKSVRAFRSEPVPRRLLMEIVETARAAPSNFNSQPWRVYLLAGKAKPCFGRGDNAGIPRQHDASIFSLSTPNTNGLRLSR